MSAVNRIIHFVDIVGSIAQTRKHAFFFVYKLLYLFEELIKLKNI